MTELLSGSFVTQRMALFLGDITVEGLDTEQPLQTGEVVIIVVVLLMWAGEYRMGNQGLGSTIGGTGEGICQEKRERKTVGEDWWREVIWTILREGRLTVSPEMRVAWAPGIQGFSRSCVTILVPCKASSELSQDQGSDGGVVFQL